MHDSVHWPHNGDRVTKSHYEFVEMPTDTTVWDFSHAIETGESHDMRWMNFGDSLLVRIERGSQYIYTLHGDSLLWRSQENALLGVRDSVAYRDLTGYDSRYVSPVAPSQSAKGMVTGKNVTVRSWFCSAATRMTTWAAWLRIALAAQPRASAFNYRW